MFAYIDPLYYFSINKEQYIANMKALPFTIPSVGNSSFLIQEDKLEGFYPFLHRHEEVQICWIKKGEGTLIVQAEVFEFKAGDIFIIGSNKPHLFKNAKTGQGIESVSLFFGISSIKNPLAIVPELNSLFTQYIQLGPCTKIEANQLGYFQSLLSTLLSSTNEEKLIQFLNVLTALLKVVHLETQLTVPYSEKDGDRMKEIMTYTLNNLSNEITISRIASHIAYTPEAFCRFFKKRTNKTYIQYLNELRINAACRQILEQQDQNISQIAFECGYNNVSHFNRVFKKIKGASPLNFKRKTQLT